MKLWSSLPWLGCGLLGFGSVLLLIPGLLAVCDRLQFNRQRDWHHACRTAVPRVGGLALVAAYLGLEGFVAIFLKEEYQFSSSRLAIVCSSLAMFLVGFWDDLRSLGAKRKLGCQIGLALVVYYAGGIGIESLKVPFSQRIIDVGGWGAILTVFWLVGITNLINLVDGLDALAGGICLMLMCLLAYVGHQNGALALLSIGMAGALLAFLWFNFPPARIYLGDGGAYFLGFQIAISSLVSSQKGSVLAALLAPLFALALPIIDMSLVIARRGLYGLPLFRADRRHLHHRLLDLGMSRLAVVLSFYGVTLVFLLLGFAVFVFRGQWVPLLVGIGALFATWCLLKTTFRREWRAFLIRLRDSAGTRHQIQYALSLISWFHHEGPRRASLGELFSDLVFAAKRLGFTGIHLRLPEAQHYWNAEGGCPQPRLFVQELYGGSDGVLELSAPGCLRSCRRESCRAKKEWRSSHCGCADDPRLLQLMAELLAEGWTKAASNLGRERTPVL